MLFKSGLAALSKSPSVVTGLVIAVIAMFLFSLTHTSVRLMSDTMTAFQIVFWRMLVSMAMRRRMLVRAMMMVPLLRMMRMPPLPMPMLVRLVVMVGLVIEW